MYGSIVFGEDTPQRPVLIRAERGIDFQNKSACVPVREAVRIS